MKKTFLSFALLGSLAFAQDSNLLSSQELSGATLASDGHKQTLREKMLEKELKLQVPRETVPVEAINYPIKTKIPKTAEYLPMLQTLLHIEAGTLPNPIGVSIIGSFMEEHYKVTKFNAQTGPTLMGIAGISPLFNPNQHEWKLSQGDVKTKTGAVGVKLDTWLFPFMQLFATGTYLHMEQRTDVGDATIPFVKRANLIQQAALRLGLAIAKQQGTVTANNMTVHVNPIENTLDGWAVMGGTNLAIGYKGFFLSCMIAGGYVKLDDLQNNVKGFVKKPFMYVAPRVGYSLGGVFTAHFGVQRVELFGSTGGNDLSASTGGLVQSYSVEIDKYPVNFLVGTNFTPMRDLGISFEYVFSPDVKGLNAEIAYRF